MAKKKKALLGIGTIFLIVVAYFTYEHVLYVSTDNAQIQAHSVMLAAKVGGYITKVNVVEGQQVKKDDVLVEIDDRDYQNTLTQIKGELTSIEARKKDAEKNFGRLRGLYSSNAISSQQFDASSAAFAEVKAKYDAVSAQVAQADLNVANTKIKAPSNGFIAKRAAEEGQLASPGVPLMGFVDSDERWIIANFKETEIEDIQVGKKVDVKVDAISGIAFEGVVASISSATGATFTLLPPDNATGNFTKVVQRVPVKIELKNLDIQQIEKLRAGLSAQVKVHKY